MQMQRNLVWEFLFGIFRNTLFQSSCGSFLNVIHFCYIQLEEGDPKKTPRALAKLGRAGTCFGKPWGLYPSPSLKFMGFVLMKTLRSGTFKPCGIPTMTEHPKLSHFWMCETETNSCSSNSEKHESCGIRNHKRCMQSDWWQETQPCTPRKSRLSCQTLQAAIYIRCKRH